MENKELKLMKKKKVLHCEQWTHLAQAGFGLAAVKSVMYLQCTFKLHQIWCYTVSSGLIWLKQGLVWLL